MNKSVNCGQQLAIAYRGQLRSASAVIDSVEEPTGGTPADFKKARRRKATLADPTKVDRLPPHSIEAEQGVLGCVLLSPNDCLGHCIEKFQSGPEVFYDLRHRTVYEALVEMYERKHAIDLITLQQQLKDRQQLEGVGGLAYLASLPDAVPSAANLDYYLEIVREKHVLRRMIGTCTEVVSRAYEHQGEVDTLLDEVERDILRISGDRVTTGSPTMKELVHRAIHHIEAYHQRQGQLGGLGTGFIDLDKMTDGLHEGEMVVIAARPSMGKTSLAMNMAEHIAVTPPQASSPRRRSSSTTPAGFPSCNCAPRPVACTSSTASSFSSLTTSSCSILLRAEPKTVSRKLRIFPTESKPWRRN